MHVSNHKTNDTNHDSKNYMYMAINACSEHNLDINWQYFFTSKKIRKEEYSSIKTNQ